MDERQMVNMRTFGAALAGGARAAHLPRLLSPGEFEDGTDHRVVSLGGWTCDVCGREVNGQTDDDGTPLMQGDAVYHTDTRAG
jgi:hypothetical protein